MEQYPPWGQWYKLSCEMHFDPDSGAEPGFGLPNDVRVISACYKPAEKLQEWCDWMEDTP